MLNKLLHGIKTYNNVFSEEEKSKLLNDSFPHLKFWDDHPGLQTGNKMHNIVNIPHIKYFTYEECWMNFTDVNFPDWEAWHTHDRYTRTCVYYFNDCPGTVFKGRFGKFQLKGVANSMITFPGSLLHTAPLNKSGVRYTMVFNILEEWSSGLWHWS